jgi:hypothetical protein
MRPITAWGGRRSPDTFEPYIFSSGRRNFSFGDFSCSGRGPSGPRLFFVALDHGPGTRGSGPLRTTEARYSPGRSIAQSPTASGSDLLAIPRATQKRKSPSLSRGTVMPWALASSMITLGVGPWGRSPSLIVGACALVASSACRWNSAGSQPCSSMMLRSSRSLYSVTMICPSFRPPSGRFSPPALDYKTHAPPMLPARPDSSPFSTLLVLNGSWKRYKGDREVWGSSGRCSIFRSLSL